MTGKEHSGERVQDSSQWPLTDWSGLRAAADWGGTDQGSMARFLERYSEALRAFLQKAFPSEHGRIDELLQDFVEDKLLREGWLCNAQESRGKLRHLLKTSLRNFVLDRLRKEKRHEAARQELATVPPSSACEDAFDFAWARLVLREALQQMEADCERGGQDAPQRVNIWRLFRARVADPAMSGAAPMPYEEAVSAFGIRSPAAAQNMLATGKRMFRRHFEQAIRGYEKDAPAAAAEARELRLFLQTLEQNH